MSFGPKYAAPPPSALTLPRDPTVDTNAAMQTAAQQAADAARKRAQQAQGRASTILGSAYQPKPAAVTPLGTSAPIVAPPVTFLTRR